jgi:hypothetical protein
MANMISMNISDSFKIIFGDSYEICVGIAVASREIQASSMATTSELGKHGPHNRDASTRVFTLLSTI